MAIADLYKHWIFRQLSWITGAYVITQLLRLIANVVLTRLLAPQLFGIMMIANTFRVGLELLSDVGVGQSIISNPNGGNPRFYNTAWSIQFVRGIILSVSVFALAGPVSEFYGEPELGHVLYAFSVLIILTGITSPAHFLLLRSGNVKSLSIAEAGVSIISLVSSIYLAWLWPTVWSLVLALSISTLASTLVSFLLMDSKTLRWAWDREAVKQIANFGKWIFLSSLVLFLSMNFDRLYLAKVVPLALFGVYGVARTFSDLAAQLVQRVGNLMIFPRVAASGKVGDDLRIAIRRPRRLALAVSAAGLGLAVAGSDVLITTLYDGRYHLAGFMLPILMCGVWFSILAGFSEALSMGISAPADVAKANGLKLVFMCVALPALMSYFGFVVALMVMGVSDFVRYCVLCYFSIRRRISFVMDDLYFTCAYLCMIVLWRSFFWWVGVVPSIKEWWQIGTAAL